MKLSHETPYIYIAMPVYNCINTVKLSLESILLQTYKNWILLISDNCSTDGTYEYCLEVAKYDKRISVIQQESNIGAWPNFMYLLSKCEHDYFKLQAADDVLDADYLLCNIINLLSEQNLIGSCSPDFAETKNSNSTIKINDHEFKGDYDKKFRKFLHLAEFSNATFYSVFRKEAAGVIDTNFKRQDALILDWAFMLRVLELGDIRRSHGNPTCMGAQGFSTKRYSWKSLLNKWTDYIFPYQNFTRAVSPSIKKLNTCSKLVYLKFQFKIHFGIFRGLISFVISEKIKKYNTL
jgi:glycosyltransferase involved in cell wall biosynthesis